MIHFRCLGYFDPKSPATRNVRPQGPKPAHPLPRATFEAVLSRFPAEVASLVEYYDEGMVGSFLSMPCQFHAFERALIEEAGCSVLSMRLEVVYPQYR